MKLLFFMAGNDIRKLYTQLGREQPLILLSGKKGVGKTSMLAAGFVPRIENNFEVAYTVLDVRIQPKESHLH
jgi:DNA replication protein DnaC